MELVIAQLDELRTRLTHHFESLVREREHLSCALSGGATALVFLGALRAARVDWSRVTLFWGDERAVPPDDPDSNFGVANRLLLAPLGARAPRAHRMPADHPSLDEAALHYDQLLAHELGGGPLDLALLGVGEDGHVCSIFPGHEFDQDGDLRVIAVDHSPKPPPRRLSLTLGFLCQTRKVWLVGIGPRKVLALQAAVSRIRLETPLDRLVRQVPDVTVFTDQALWRT